MLQKMVNIMSSPAVHVCRACYYRHGLVDISHLSLTRGFGTALAGERCATMCGTHSTKQKLVTCHCEKQNHLGPLSFWSSKLCPASRLSQRLFHRNNHVAKTSSARGTWSKIFSEGLVDDAKSVSLTSPAVAAERHASSNDPEVQDFSKRKSMATSNDRLVKAILYEAQKGFINVIGKNKRFGDFLFEQVTSQPEVDHVGSSLESQELLRTLSQKSSLYDKMEQQERISLLNQVAQSLGYRSLQDLVDHDSASFEASQGLEVQPYLKDEDQCTLNASLENKESPKNKKEGVVEDGSNHESRVSVDMVHPAIVYGSSQPIELCIPGGRSTAISSPQFAGVVHDISSSSQTRGRKVATSKRVKKNVARVSADIKVAKEPQLDETSPKPKAQAMKVLVTKRSSTKENWGLDIPMSSVKCLSAYQRSRLEENGFLTMRMLLQHYPRMYRNFQLAGQRVEDGQHLSFVGTIVQSRGLPRGPSLGLTEVVIKSEVDPSNPEELLSEVMEGMPCDERPGRTVFLHVKKFYKGFRYASPWFLNAMAAKYPVSSQVTVCGKVKAMFQPDHFEIREFNLELWDEETPKLEGVSGAFEVPSSGKPYPVYPGKGGLQPKTIEFCIQRILPVLPAQLDPFPEDLCKKLQLQDLEQAYRGIHTPADANDAELARQRLVFDEFFYLQLGMLLQRQELAGKCLAAAGTGDLALVSKSGVLDMDKWSPLTLKLVKALPYTLTQSQIKAAGEIMWDLQRPIPMSRLLQGDVGCGKTIVAFLALLEVVDAGYQGALMAPTEFLAVQHYQRITSWLEKLEESERPRVALLTGSTPVSKARVIRSGFESGEIALAIGTHSLIAESVKFSALRLGVIDEQHRFGVAQRGRLNNKLREAAQIPDASEADIPKAVPYGPPHLLAMSATPIPRTLALALHGDMALSQITELPPGRPDTATHAILGDEKGRQEVYKRVRQELEDGGRVFVVFPVIEESEQLPDVRAAESEFNILEEEFKNYKCGLVHGRLRPNEKDEAMERFKSGDTQVLVSTTVIEVGIDIPEASMIVVEHAERYGMAQLHQLRGRVGRGTRESSCILLGSKPSSLARLKLLETSRDGFYLAEIDLKLRGPGDLLGKQQSGYLPEFHIARLEKDGEILEKARAAAEELLQVHIKLEGLPRIRQELSMRRLPNSLS